MSAIRTHQPVFDDHSEQKRFACDHDQCMKSFDRMGDLIRHKDVHNPEKPFICEWPGCYHGFRQKSNLMIHFRIHTGEKPLFCPDSVSCKFHTGDPSRLTRHRKSKHGHVPTRGLRKSTVSKPKGSTSHRRQAPQSLRSLPSSPSSSSCPSLSSSPSPSPSPLFSIHCFPATPITPVTESPEPLEYNATELCYPADTTPALPSPEISTPHKGIQHSAWDLNYAYSNEHLCFDTFPKMTYPAYQAGPGLEFDASGSSTTVVDAGAMYDMGGFNSDGYFTTYSSERWSDYQLDPLAFTNGPSDLAIGNYLSSMKPVDVGVETDFAFAPSPFELPFDSTLAAAMDELFMTPTSYPSMSC
ncbi:hypothetical protein D9758_004474 [Tetrapyrgos nigripes]|uniref:C2H2-type domain-containing protein n=1 Tax=Tetrapyrgos nigripes TaxID=182062 RepID=A0A8H5GNA6_9AGAR|nr:hypothetical protein D9758_004474 [Tetrapyrgos nigripes]